MGNNREKYFGKLRELQRFLNTLSDDQLDAETATHDSYFLEVGKSQSSDYFYYTIEPLEGGEE